MKKYRKITDDVDEVKAVVPGESSSSAGGKDRELEAKHNETSSTDAASDQTQELRQRTPSEPPSFRFIDSSAVPSPPPPFSFHFLGKPLDILKKKIRRKKEYSKCHQLTWAGHGKVS
jgi:hypothetical protein